MRAERRPPAPRSIASIVVALLALALLMPASSAIAGPPPPWVTVKVYLGGCGASGQVDLGTDGPLTIKRRQNRKLLIPPTPDAAAATGGFDVPMIKTLGKAFYWKQLIDDGTYPTTSDLARALKLEPGWAAEVQRMTMLAPDIVEAIFEGRQPRQLNLHTLRGREDLLPRDWGEQRRLLGFPDA